MRKTAGLAAADASLARAAVARSRVSRAKTLATYVGVLRSGGPAAEAEFSAFVQELLNGETFFFRDQGQMTLLRDVILPEILRRRREDRSIRIWSAGCSTGEEPYSVAMLLDELLPDRSAWSIHILGTDVHPGFLDRAREGLYGPNSFRPHAPLGAAALGRHFLREGDAWRISSRIREMVRFETHNLVRDPVHAAHSQMDLVLCRNVLIYFDPVAARAVSETLAAALREGGYLMAGHTDLQGRAPPRIVPILHPAAVVYRRAFLPGPPVEPRQAVALEDEPPRPEPPPAPEAGSNPHCDAPESIPRTGAVGADRADRLRSAARRAADLGLHGTAIALAKEGLQADPTDVALHHLLSHIADELGDQAEAKSRLRTVIYLEPENVQAYLRLALLFDLDGEHQRASRSRAAAMAIVQRAAPDSPVAGFEGLTAGTLVERLRILMGPQHGRGEGPHA